MIILPINSDNELVIYNQGLTKSLCSIQDYIILFEQSPEAYDIKHFQCVSVTSSPFQNSLGSPFLYFFFPLSKYIPWLSSWIFAIILLCKWIFRIPCNVVELLPIQDDLQLEKKKKNTASTLYYPQALDLEWKCWEVSISELSFFSLISTPIPITIIALQFSISVKVTANQFRNPINLPPSPSQFKQLLTRLNFVLSSLFTSLLLLPQFRSHCLPIRFQK